MEESITKALTQQLKGGRLEVVYSFFYRDVIDCNLRIDLLT